MQALFPAGFVSLDEIGGALIVGFADRQFDTSQYFMLQRMLVPDDDDGVYLERNDQAYGTNAEVSSCSLARDRIELTVDESAAKRLRTETTFAVDFSCDEEQWQRLREGLERIFAGTDCRLSWTTES